MRFVFLCSLIFPVLVWANVDEEFLLERVSRNNLFTLGQAKTVKGAEERTGYLGRSFLPVVTLDLGQEKFQTGKYRTFSHPYGYLEGRLNLFRGGKDSLEDQYRDVQLRIAEHHKSAVVRDQLSRARKLQWEIIYNIELIKILEAEKKVNSRIQVQADRRARSGVSTRSDSLEFSIYQSELDESIESLAHENKILKIGLLPLLGLEKEEDLRFDEKLVHNHDDILLRKDYVSLNHPEVAEMYAEAESFDMVTQSQKRWWAPSLDLYGGYYLYTLRDRDYLAIREREDRVVGLRLSFTLFDGMNGPTEATSMHYQKEAKKLQARHLEKETMAKYLMLKEDLVHTHEVMHYVEDRLTKSREYLRVTLSEYDRGVKNSLDALTAMQRYYRYEKQYLDKKKEYEIIRADLLSLRGE